jgi:hypothetical protein
MRISSIGENERGFELVGVQGEPQRSFASSSWGFQTLLCGFLALAREERQEPIGVGNAGMLSGIKAGRGAACRAIR